MATTTPPSDPYSLTDDQLEFRDAIRKMVAERVAPRAAEIDAKAEYPWDLRRLFAEHDLFGLPFDEEYGGTGTGTLMLNVAVEEVARACASSALMLMIQELGTLPIKLYGSEELKQRFLPRCASGEWSPAFALSEPEAGSDAGGMITRAVRTRRPRARTASARSSWRPTAPASASASSSTSSASRARRPASRSSTTCGSPPGT
jgi:alkylation response protein AidB-like acyl-CoA dehydrogenase